MLLIDAFNVLLTTSVLPPRLAGLEVDGLVRLLGISRYARTRIVLVCDGAPPSAGSASAAWSAGAVAGRAGTSRSGNSSNVNVVHAGGGRDADSLVEEILARDSAARRITVVSNDRRVQRAASRAGASILDSGAFLRQLVFDEARPAAVPHPRNQHKIPLGGPEVAAWIREFGFDHAELAELAALASQPSLPGPARPPPVPPPALTVPEAPNPAQPPRPGPSRSPGQADHSPPDVVQIDSVLRELLEGASGAIRLEDLDMRRWLDGLDPGG